MSRPTMFGRGWCAVAGRVGSASAAELTVAVVATLFSISYLLLTFGFFRKNAITKRAPRHPYRTRSKSRTMGDQEEIQEQMKADMSALKEKMASMMDAMLGMRQLMENNVCHTLISSGDHPLLGCDPRLTTSRYLAPIVRQFVKFRDVPKVKRKHYSTIREVP